MRQSKYQALIEKYFPKEAWGVAPYIAHFESSDDPSKLNVTNSENHAWAKPPTFDYSEAETYYKDTPWVGSFGLFQVGAWVLARKDGKPVVTDTNGSPLTSYRQLLDAETNIYVASQVYKSSLKWSGIPWRDWSTKEMAEKAYNTDLKAQRSQSKPTKDDVIPISVTKSSPAASVKEISPVSDEPIIVQPIKHPNAAWLEEPAKAEIKKSLVSLDTYARSKVGDNLQRFAKSVVAIVPLHQAWEQWVGQIEAKWTFLEPYGGILANADFWLAILLGIIFYKLQSWVYKKYVKNNPNAHWLISWFIGLFGSHRHAKISKQFKKQLLN